MLLCDTSGLIAYFDSSDAWHRQVSAAVAADRGPFVVSPFVLAELDYLLGTRRGIEAELAVLRELGSRAWELAGFGPQDLRAAADLVDLYRDQDVGLADASLVVLSGRYRTDRVLTLDQRHFRVLRTFAGSVFHLLPDSL